MRIVSKFHDYYDTASAYGIDKEWVYVREEKTVFEKPQYTTWGKDEIQLPISRNKMRTFGVGFFIIGFCGKLYPGIRFMNFGPGPRTKDKLIYDLETAVSYLEQAPESRNGFTNWRKKDLIQRTQKFFNDLEWRSRWSKAEHSHSTLLEVFRKYRVPVFSYDVTTEELVINPVLRDYDFVRIKDPVTTFQEIYQYLSGVLGNTEIDTVGISDEDLAAEKGYNEWSFRRHKEESKKPRRRGK